MHISPLSHEYYARKQNAMIRSLRHAVIATTISLVIITGMVIVEAINRAYSYAATPQYPAYDPTSIGDGRLGDATKIN